MNARTAAAATHLIFGGLTVLGAVKGLVTPPELPYDPVWNAFLYRFGGALGSLVFGVALIALGVLTRLAKDPGENTELNFTYEAQIPLAPVMAVFLLWIASLFFSSILPYTGQRGIVPGQISTGLLLVPMMLLGVWFLLHHRRLAILNSAARTLEISYGKPWAILRLRSSFSDYQSVSIHEVSRARGSVFRLVASGTKGSRMITFCFSRDAADQCLANIVSVTGWAKSG